VTAQLRASAEQNVNRLKANRYPGRGIIIGLTPDGTRLMQVYWIMGRSENSRNRIFVKEDNGFVRTEAKDPAKLSDPSLIIYYPVKHWRDAHIVTNGDQTDTIFDALSGGGAFAESAGAGVRPGARPSGEVHADAAAAWDGAFEAALSTRSFEPDAPNYTPRISGIVDLKDRQCAYRLSILKTNMGDPSQTQRFFYHYEQALPGYGHLIHTYSGDGEPLPSFAGEPALVPLADDIGATARMYWDLLDADNKIALLVKTIRRDNGQTEIRIVNKE
jgi:hypothetical protein